MKVIETKGVREIKGLGRSRNRGFSGWRRSPQVCAPKAHVTTTIADPEGLRHPEGPGESASTKQKMLKMNERTHYVL